MPLFRNKPMEVEAVRWIAENVAEMEAFIELKPCLAFVRDTDALLLRFTSEEGESFFIEEGDWVVSLANGKGTVLSHEMFQRRFELVPGIILPALIA